MIRINLLPEEYRKKSRTSVKVLLGVCAGVAVNGALCAWYAWLAFGVSAEIDSERASLQTELDGLAAQVKHHRALESEKKRFAGREETLTRITKSRISWTRKLDELVTTISLGDQDHRHFVWLDDLSVQQSSDPRAKSAGTFKASGHSGSDNFAQVANFLEDVENSSFVEDFLPPSPPEGTQTSVDKELVPPVVWNFPLSLQLKSPAKPEPAKNAAAAKAAAAAPGAAQGSEAKE